MKHIKKFNEAVQLPGENSYYLKVITDYDNELLRGMFANEEYYQIYVKSSSSSPIALVVKFKSPTEEKSIDVSGKRRDIKYGVHVTRGGDIHVSTTDDRKATIEELADYLGETDVERLNSYILDELSKWEMKPVEKITFVKK
jgi:hypothetical protein